MRYTCVSGTRKSAVCFYRESSLKDKPHDHYLKIWYISATLLRYKIAYWVLLGRKLITMKRYLFLLLAIVSVVVMIAMSGCKKNEEEPELATTGELNGHAWVDLGLPSGTKWATCNVGATTPEGYGNYYAWGETTTKETYNGSTYKYGNGPEGLIKYCPETTLTTDWGMTFGRDGYTDTLTTLEPSDDAATVNWGGNWRMPTQDEIQELTDNCNMTWNTQNGINGILFTSKTNSNSIFLPTAGYRYDSELNDAGSDGYYWSSSLKAFEPIFAIRLDLDEYYCSVSMNSRSHGCPVRPVCTR